MEFIKKVDVMNNQFLEETRPLRYTKGLAPEEANHSAIPDHKARDVYSLGVLIEEVLSGRISSYCAVLYFSADKTKRRVSLSK